MSRCLLRSLFGVWFRQDFCCGLQSNCELQSIRTGKYLRLWQNWHGLYTTWGYSCLVQTEKLRQYRLHIIHIKCTNPYALCKCLCNTSSRSFLRNTAMEHNLTSECIYQLILLAFFVYVESPASNMNVPHNPQLLCGDTKKNQTK